MPKFPKCDFKGCDFQAKFGLPGKAPRRCDSHILHGMMIFPDTKCDVQVKTDMGELIPCGKQAFFGNRHKPKRCEEHKAAYTQNHVVNGKCNSCGTINLLTLVGVCLNVQKCEQRLLRPQREAKAKEIEDRIKQ
eukprot:7017339-Pyramimonas_sp.AAC.1